MSDESIRVITIKGHGEQRVRNLLNGGYLNDDLTDDMEEVLKELEDLRKANRELRYRLRIKEHELAQYKDVHIQIINAAQERAERRSRETERHGLAIAAGGVFAITLASTIVCHLIIG